MFRFASPLYLLLILIIPAGLFVKYRSTRSHINMPDLTSVESMPQTIVIYVAQWLPVFKVISLILLIIALARPQWGDQKVTVSTEGINIILALDLSESMRALDFKKDGNIVTRLEAAKHVVQDFIVKRNGDRIGMVVFGSHAFTQLPLTRDYNTIAFMLEVLKIGAAGPGTAIGDAIGISIKRLEDIKSTSNIIILLTDGKSNSGKLTWQEAIKIAAHRNIKIYTIGVGSRGKAPFLVDDIFGRRYVYQKVDMDLDALKKIAEETTGSFFEAKDTEGLSKIYDIIDQLEKTKADIIKWVEYKDLYLDFLAAGLFIYVLYLILSNTRFLRIP